MLDPTVTVACFDRDSVTISVAKKHVDAVNLLLSAFVKSVDAHMAAVAAEENLN